jgi:hypothetical protein
LNPRPRSRNRELEVHRSWYFLRSQQRTSSKRHGDRYAGFKATVELAAKVLRIVWGVWRRGPHTIRYALEGFGASPAERWRAALDDIVFPRE